MKNLSSFVAQAFSECYLRRGRGKWRQVNDYKKYAKDLVTHEKIRREKLAEDNITFDDEEVDGLMFPHHDPLVITVLDTDVKSILVDPYISSNIMHLLVIKEI